MGSLERRAAKVTDNGSASWVFFFKLNRTGAAKSDGWAGFALV